ncbi:hypothetical protein MTY66_61950 (plasmid) [Mycolicibacterium sp. TY66]|uniref:hypothetical protein n=1 Tax=unclassified Mycolicibacterium TaxID=2636767 RepID=UPI001BB45BC0|nr:MULTISPECIES: hypothetical protein [unclassified Mycolicibacterium]BCI84570.1 hypothetical protein MTY66_61950 [Mycolicibacterium sp. TY66]BCJ84800.1 hypothetical protein MTY81_61730 [Mycolicibacterium sp. TY81]
MADTKNIDSIMESLTALQLSIVEQNARLDRIGAFMDDPVNPTIIVRVQHGKILDIAASDAITSMAAHDLQNLVNAVIFGAFVDWFENVKPPTAA